MIELLNYNTRRVSKVVSVASILKIIRESSQSRDDERKYIIYTVGTVLKRESVAGEFL